MSEEKKPARLSIIWALEAHAELRRVDRDTALDILRCTGRFLATRNGDVKKLKPPQTGFRLRCGDYRLFFEHGNETSIEIIGVRRRREAYR